MHLVHVFHCLANGWNPHEKKLLFLHAYLLMSTSCNSSLDQKVFLLLRLSIRCSDHKDWDQASMEEERGTQNECPWLSELSCGQYTAVVLQQDIATEQSIMSWYDGWSHMIPKITMWGTCDCGPLVYCCTSGTWWFEYSVIIISYANVDVCIILRALMSLNSGIICLSALFQAGSSGPSCHTHCVFPSVQEWVV